MQISHAIWRNRLPWSSSQRTYFVEDYLCFTVTLRASHLWYSNYSDYQKLLYKIIKDKHELGIGYQRIAYWLNEHGYKTLRGHKFKNTHVFSILKKKHSRDKRLKKIHNYEIESFRILVLETPRMLED